jgi:hypothetical protein
MNNEMLKAIHAEVISLLPTLKNILITDSYNRKINSKQAYVCDNCVFNSRIDEWDIINTPAIITLSAKCINHNIDMKMRFCPTHHYDYNPNELIFSFCGRYGKLNLTDFTRELLLTRIIKMIIGEPAFW